MSDYGSRHTDPLLVNMIREDREEMGIKREEEDKEIYIRHVLSTNLAAITLDQLKRATEGDAKLSKIVEEKKEGKKSKKSSKGPYEKMWDDIGERSRILTKTRR